MTSPPWCSTRTSYGPPRSTNPAPSSGCSPPPQARAEAEAARARAGAGAARRRALRRRLRPVPPRPRPGRPRRPRPVRRRRSGPYGRYGGVLRPYRGRARWHRPVAWLLAVVMGIGMVALAFSAVYRGASSEPRRQGPAPGHQQRGQPDERPALGRPGPGRPGPVHAAPSGPAGRRPGTGVRRCRRTRPGAQPYGRDPAHAVRPTARSPSAVRQRSPCHGSHVGSRSRRLPRPRTP